MSTASAGIPSDQPQRTSHQPGTLAVLAATAIGGILGTRLGKAPLMLAAGAAAYSLFKQKTAPAPATVPEPLPPPAPPQEAPALSQIEEWLSRQISREAQAPFIELAATEAAPQELAPEEPEDDYHPQSLLLDDAEEASFFPPSNDSFARLTEAVPQQAPELVAPVEPESAPTPPQAQETTPAVTAATDAAWTLGVEPLPSLNETETVPFNALASSMFFTAPVQQEDLEPPPMFSLPVFQGAAFPDEIDVPPPLEPASLEPVVPLTPEPALEQDTPPQPAPVTELSQAEEPTPEIAVQLATPGDASFDPPLEAVPENPWKPELDVPAVPFPVSPSSHTPIHVLDAEIILRPRAPMQNSVTTKSKISSPDAIKKDFAETIESAPADSSSDASADTPQLSTRDPRSRPAWRSWWRGD